MMKYAEISAEKKIIGYKIIFLFTLATALIIVLLGSLAPVSNWDTFLHLYFGQHFLNDWTIQDHDMPSYGSGDWTPTQWLTQMVMASIYGAFGWTGIHVSFFVVYISIAVLAFYTFTRNNNLAVGGSLALVYVWAINGWLAPRPVVLSFLLALVAVLILQKALIKPKIAFAFVPLFFLWVMVHGGWIILIPLPVILVLGAVLAKDKARVKIFGLAAGLTLIATALTPTGLNAWKAVLVVNDRSKFYDEFDRLGWHEPLALTAVALAVLAGVMLWRAKFDFTHLGIYGFGCLLMAYNGRTFAFGLLLVMILIVSTPKMKFDLGIKIAASLLLGATLTTFVVIAPQLSVAHPFTKAMDAELQSLPANSNIYTYDFIGSYVLFQYPELNPTAHGYVDVYSDQEWENLAILFQLKNGWQEALANTESDYALLPEDSVDAEAFQAEGWTVLFKDGDGVLLKAPSGS